MAAIAGSNVVTFKSAAKFGGSVDCNKFAHQFRQWSPVCGGVGSGQARTRIGGLHCTSKSSISSSGKKIIFDSFFFSLTVHRIICIHK